MSIMIAEFNEALVEAGASDEKAKAAASVVPAEDRLATNLISTILKLIYKRSGLN